MKDVARQTRSHLVQLFEQQGLRPRHDLGQNFLVDLNLHALIVRHARLSTADVVLEVGPGAGSLTTLLADAAGHVVAVECDPHVFAHAQRVLGARENVTLLLGDALANKNQLSPEMVAAVQQALERVRAEEAEGLQPLGVPEDVDNPWALRPAETTLKLVANLPYSIATPVISNLVASELPWSRMVVTLQWELAERMQARPGTSDYSALSVFLQAQARIKTIRKLPPSVFWPPPKVDSAVVRIERDREAQAKIADRVYFHDFVREVFTQRRKRLLGVLAQIFGEKRPRDGHPWASERNALTRDAIEALFFELRIPADARAEQLPVATLVELSNRLATTVLSNLTPDS